MIRKGKFMKGPAEFKIMKERFVVNVQTDCSTLFNDNFGSKQLYISIRSTSHYGDVPYHLNSKYF